MFNNLQKIVTYALFIANYSLIQAISSPPTAIEHTPEATFRIGVSKGPSNTITTTITPANSGAGLNNNNNNNAVELPSEETVLADNRTAMPTSQILKTTAPAYMGALIVMGSNNDIKDNYNDVALVVLIPYNADQLTTVDKFIKWLYEQQTVNLSKLKSELALQAKRLKIFNIKSALVYKTDLQPYMTSNKTSFKDAVTKFAEILGEYEKIMSKLQFDDLKPAVLNKMQAVKK